MVSVSGPDRSPSVGMTAQMGVRIGWLDLPGPVQSEIEKIIGGPVVEAVSQTGGFSPGTADRVRTSDGTRAFVKAVAPHLNPDSPKLHRREATNAAALPAAVPAPRFLGCYDDGDWIALVFEDVDGRHPHTPWLDDELDAVLVALKRTAEALTPVPLALAHLPAAVSEYETDFIAWERIRDDPPGDLDPWLADRLPALVDAGRRAVASLVGDTGVHVDVRADNLLIRPAGDVLIVDWPWLSRGPGWLDSTMLMASVARWGTIDLDPWLHRIAADFAVEVGTLRDLLVALTGFFVDAARLPPVPGLPTVAEWRRANGAALLAWMKTWHS
jgi:aminoglycoside phosphotransferase (APT) family kinase protein